MTREEHIAALKTAADPLRVAAALGLQGRGRRFFCPVCQPSGGKTPDLVVGDKGFTCHKCGEKGDLLKLIEVAGNMDFKSAVAWLEDHTGVRPGANSEHLSNKTGSHKGRVEIVDPGASWRAVSPSSLDVPPFFANTPAYNAFLSACRPVEGRVMDWLTKDKGVLPKVVEDMGLRFCGREYKDVMDDLTKRFGEDELLAAGLLKRSPSKAGRPVPSFWHYYAAKAGFLVIPYLKDGLPVYLKVRPPVSRDEAQRRGIVRFMNTAAAVPCLYNVDVLDLQPKEVLICEGESDTWTALSNGFAAVGSPGAKAFKEVWVEGFRGIEAKDGRSGVFLVLDADEAGKEGSRIIAGLFRRAGLPIPRELSLPPGMDLTDYMGETET